MTTKKTKKRHNIEIKRTKKEKNMLITFSKYKFSICNKTSELIIFIDVEVGIVVFSLVEKTFSYDHLSIEVVANCFMSGQPLKGDPIDFLLEACQKVKSIN